MKKMLFVTLLAVASLAICGCKEKTTEEKLQDAADSAQKDAAAAQKDMGKKLDNALSN
ncbi:MAG: hypothetical protein R6V06_03775 [Kiritimatiellia bacterium]